MTANVVAIGPHLERKRRTKQMARLITSPDEWMALYTKRPMALLLVTPTEQGLYAIGKAANHE